ncbi:ATP-binding cassette subfamily B protein/subfamily B ATP-binding cassette protein MsbA [Keratinibaculum paraultunense]|uniref:ATP-binding cassette subfamily B protein/subfamily B ATP-binding cassette protein MsbA n=1 Tax=Keratinibaculum paraultunense TaxID=1278232 RepID=A0A4R3KSU4_9FIRM|nr:ABC transporter ATP-binding protein [Keratinibaculum paraultunense]TCS87499.1 ATP-binding cassette subfamily B protein/subfamily B ATP-binding cassette protein MsbA [Keratinibaculum paraultunense]
MNKNTDKTYDSKLMKRLLKYAKPYWHYFVITIILMMLITGLELLRPYLLKITIDDYINGYKKPMYEVDVSEPIEGIIFNGKKYVRLNKLDSKQIEKLSNYPKKVLLKKNNKYYLLDYEEKDISQGISISKKDYEKFIKQDIDGITKIGLIFLLAIIVVFILNYLQTYVLNYTGQKIIFNIRQDLYSHIQSLSLSYFDKNPVGRLVTRVTNDAETLNEMYTGVLINLFKDVFILVGIIIVMLKMNYKLALISFSLIPLILIASIVFRKKIREVYRLGRVQLAKINSTLNENITGMKTIQIFKKEEKISKQFDEINTAYLNTAKKEVNLHAIFRPSIEIINSLGLVTLVYYGSGQVISGYIEFGVLYAFIDYLQKFFQPILDLTEKYNILQAAMASSEKIFSILDEDDMIENTNNPVPIKELKGKIEFKNVWFAYEDENWVLKDVSFTINPGEIVAFVGATGAGKSSIINLITRFYDIQKGEILIDGVNIKKYDKFELRKHIGVVLQDVFLFTGTIKDNIRLNNYNISDEEIKQIAKYVNAHHFIEKLPRQYDEPVMERGATLSAGEKQLLAFARTLAFDPSILILDEATSNIDTETELLIQDALQKLIKGRTTIAVAHRLSTIQNSDKIIVLKNGVIQEMGTHQELLENEGIYYDLYKLQYKESFYES